MAGPDSNNSELKDALRRFADDSHPERFLYLWGPAASGKTHLLRSLSAEKARYVDAAHATAEALCYHPATQLYLLDNCEQLNPERQIDAFALYNQIRIEGGRLVCSGAVAPKGLLLREDLRTRMGWGLIYQLHPLTDADKISAFGQIARERDWPLAANVLPYLITHYRRDMRSLVSVLDALDRYSLQTRRQMTLPLLRELLRSASGELGGADQPDESGEPLPPGAQADKHKIAHEITHEIAHEITHDTINPEPGGPEAAPIPT